MASDDSTTDERCGHPRQRDQEPCENPATEPDGSCWLNTHGPNAEDEEGDGRGGPVGNDHAEGNPGGGAEEGNFNAMDTGLHASVKRRLDWFRELDARHPEANWIELYEDYYTEFYPKCENKSEAADLATLAVIRDRLERPLVIEGPTFEQVIDDDTGETATMPKSGLIESLTDVRREMRLLAKYEGVTGRSSSGGEGYAGLSDLWEEDREKAEP